MTSKEDLKMIKIKCHPNANPNPMIDEALNNIEKDLERLEEIDNANPSEALGKIVLLACELGTSKDIKFAETRFPKMILTIQQALKKAQKQDKILDILKRASIQDKLFQLCDDGWGGRHIYNLSDYDNSHASDLTPDEYELIKEWLENDK